MSENFIDQNSMPTEKKESQPKGREVDVYFFRHGQATGESPSEELTPLGRHQAEEAAEKLLQELQSVGGVIKFLSSQYNRAEQTMDIMQEYMQKAIIERNISNLRLLNARERAAINAVGVTKELKDKGIESPIEYWLNNPDVLEGRSLAEISGKIKQMLSTIKKVADRLPLGEKIHYIAISHEAPEAALIHSATGKTLNEMGGKIKNCESFQVQIEGKSEKNPILNFRGNQAELIL
jgi:broad specificity phosphatase PhoE